MSYNAMKIRRIAIEKFRRFEDIEFTLGNKITLIAGQNGTSKSTLLGMIAQPFSFGVFTGSNAHKPNKSEYTKNYHGKVLSNFRDIMGRAFSYDCHDVFRLSRIHDTDPEKYLYKLFLEGKAIENHEKLMRQGLMLRAQKRPNETKIRFVAGPGKSSEEGEGNFPHPVIYLGLDRHWPLALEKKISIENEFEIDPEAKEWFVENYNKILLLDEPKNKAELVQRDKKNKGFVGVAATDYNSESFSAGQVNLVQILTAVLSFKKLKIELADKYQGGLILIDEIDSTLHADAQSSLLKMLLEACEDYNLQVVGTTHSLHLLKTAFASKQSKDIRTLYLLRQDHQVLDSGFKSYEEIELNLETKAVLPPQKSTDKSHNKVSLVLEDKTANDLFYSIFGHKLDKYIKRHTSPSQKSVSSSYIMNILPLVNKVPELQKIILLPDGDKEGEVCKIAKKSPNIICLPGKTYLEKEIFEYLSSLPQSDTLWKKCKGRGYTKQFAITKAKADMPKFKEKDNKNEKEKKWYKRWYKNQSKFWGTGNKIVFEAWARYNKTILHKFCNSVFKSIEKILKTQIPDKLKNEIKSKYD